MSGPDYIKPCSMRLLLQQGLVNQSIYISVQQLYLLMQVLLQLRLKTGKPFRETLLWAQMGSM
jgi:hypothetical protein